MAAALISRAPQRLMTEMIEAEDRDVLDDSIEDSPTSFSASGHGGGAAIRRGRDATGWGSFLDQQILRADDEGEEAGGIPGTGPGVTEQIVKKYAAAAAMRDIQRLQRKKPSHNMAQFTVGNGPGCTHRTLSAAAKSAGKAGAVIFLREDREEERETVEICSEVIIQRDPISPPLPDGEKTRVHFHGLACCIKVQGSAARATLVDISIDSTGLPAPAAVGSNNQLHRVVFKPLVHAQQRGGSSAHYSQPTSSGLGAGAGAGWQVPCCVLVCGDGRANLEGCRVSCMGGDGVRVEGPASVLVAVGASSVEKCGRYGVVVSGGGALTAENLSVLCCKGTGVISQGRGSNATLRLGSRVNGGSRTGAVAAEAGFLVLEEASICGNAHVGVLVKGQESRAKVLRCLIADNQSHGISVVDEDKAVGGGGCEPLQQMQRGIGASGVAPRRREAGTRGAGGSVEHCEVSNNSGSGLHAQGSGASLRAAHCRMERNTLSGVHAEGGAEVCCEDGITGFNGMFGVHAVKKGSVVRASGCMLGVGGEKPVLCEEALVALAGCNMPKGGLDGCSRGSGVIRVLGN